MRGRFPSSSFSPLKMVKLKQDKSIRKIYKEMKAKNKMHKNSSFLLSLKVMKTSLISVKLRWSSSSRDLDRF